MQLKTKEIALNFQEVFNSCKQKLVEDPPLPVPPQSAQYGDLNTASFTTPRTDSSNQYEDKEEDEEEDEEETDSEDEDSDDDEEDEPSVLMSEECVMHKMQNNEWQVNIL
ncbi:unnamed protein product [Rotaria socialis]|uniref:Uncharacterized protein n=1 Tax=Rotaria socialis TaxID=392032 RepID=A0A817ZV35_9BILA|nr:unnamed protein product [Rotaria socialis]